jgi:hypothetical protein
VKGSRQIWEDKPLPNKVVKVMVIAKEEWRDEIPRMPAVDICHRNRGARAEVLTYFRDTEPLVKEFYPSV